MSEAASALFGGAYAAGACWSPATPASRASWLALWLQQLGARCLRLWRCRPKAALNHSRLLRAAAGRGAGRSARRRRLVRAALRRFEPEVVFHLAAQPLVRRSYRDPAGTFDTNVMGTGAPARGRARHAQRARRWSTSPPTSATANREQRSGLPRRRRAGRPRPLQRIEGLRRAGLGQLPRVVPVDDDGRGHPVALATARAGNVIGGGDWGEDRLIPDLVRAATRRHAHPDPPPGRRAPLAACAGAAGRLSVPGRSACWQDPQRRGRSLELRPAGRRAPPGAAGHRGLCRGLAGSALGHR